MARRRLWLLATLATLTAVVVGAGYVAVRRSVLSFVTEGRHRFEEGAALGRGLAAPACVDTALVRHAPTGLASMGQPLNEQLFLEGCLRASAPAALCDSIPETDHLSDVMRFAAWSVAQCHLHALQDQGCPRVLQAVMHYCRARSRRTG